MKITIVTAVYNRADTIGQAIESVAAQDHPDVEHVVIDGASTDRTIEEIRNKAHPGMRIFSEPDSGIYDALNKGVAAATGDVVGLMHSDDFFAHDHVLSEVNRCLETTRADAVYGDLDYVSASNPNRLVRHWKSGTFKQRKLSWGWMPPHPTLFVKAAVFERLGGYDTSYRISADYEAILRWFGKGGVTPAYIPEVLVKMRVGGESNRSIERILRKSREDYRALRKNEIGGLGALACKNFGKLSQFFIRS